MATNHFLNILAPWRPRDFVDAHWEANPLVISGSPDKFTQLHFDFETFSNAIAGAPSGTIKANSVGENGEGQYIDIESHQAQQRYGSGMTICATGLDCQVDSLAALCRDTRSTLGLAGSVNCNCYLSPEGGGFGVHFDTQSVFILQIEGTKRWRYATRPSIEFPPEAIDAKPAHGLRDYVVRHPWASLESPEDARWLECTLSPGSLLYLPPGTWHRGHAGEYSLALTLTCVSHSIAGDVARILESELFSTLAWRRNLPVTLAKNPRSGKSRRVEEFTADRLTELRDFVASLSPEDIAAARQRFSKRKNRS